MTLSAGALSGKLLSVVAVLTVTSLTADQATSAQLAALVRGHWGIEANHHIRDVSYREDASTVRAGTGPAVMAALRTFAIGALNALGFTNIAQGQRLAHRDYHRPLDALGLTILKNGAVPHSPWSASAGRK